MYQSIAVLAAAFIVSGYGCSPINVNVPLSTVRVKTVGSRPLISTAHVSSPFTACTQIFVPPGRRNVFVHVPCTVINRIDATDITLYMNGSELGIKPGISIWKYEMIIIAPVETSGAFCIDVRGTRAVVCELSSMFVAYECEQEPTVNKE